MLLSLYKVCCYSYCAAAAVVVVIFVVTVVIVVADIVVVAVAAAAAAVIRCCRYRRYYRYCRCNRFRCRICCYSVFKRICLLVYLHNNLDNHYHWGCLACSICKQKFDKENCDTCVFRNGRPVCGECEVSGPIFNANYIHIIHKLFKYQKNSKIQTNNTTTTPQATPQTTLQTTLQTALQTATNNAENNTNNTTTIRSPASYYQPYTKQSKNLERIFPQMLSMYTKHHFQSRTH